MAERSDAELKQAARAALEQHPAFTAWDDDDPMKPKMNWKHPQAGEALALFQRNCPSDNPHSF